MSYLDEIIKMNGFVSMEEFNFLISNIDLTTTKKRIDFKQWQDKDGTKKGLMKLDFLNSAEIVSWKKREESARLISGFCIAPDKQLAGLTSGYCITPDKKRV